MKNSFVVSKTDLKKMVTSLGISEGSTEAMLAKLNKMHGHVDAVAFVGILEKIGVHNKDISNILRRVGVDDASINSVFNTLDKVKIEETYGKVSRLKLVD